MKGFCEHDNEHSSSIKLWKFLEYVSDLQLLERHHHRRFS
jgi:hypothetical protein